MPTAPSCPRCGYDLSGDIATWERKCPLAGRCPECGLNFEWAHVVSDQLRPPRWSFEHASALWPTRLGAAWIAALWPARCWRNLRLEHRVMPRRLMASMLVMLVGLWMTAGMSFSLAVAADDLRWRGWRVIGGVMTPPAGKPAGLLETIWTQYRDVLFSPFVNVETSPFRLWRGPAAGAWAATLFVGGIVMPIAFLLLPQTFGRTRVRRVHLLRGMAYTFVGTWLALLLGMICLAYVYGSGDELAYGWCFTAIGLIWSVVSWRWVVCDYLRLPQPKRVWLAMCTIGLLSGAVAGAILLPGEMHLYHWTWRL